MNKKKKAILISIFVLLFIIFIGSFLNIFDFIGNFFFNARATQDVVSLSLNFKKECNSTLVDSSGILNFTSCGMNDTLIVAKNLTMGWVANMTLYTGNFPSEWTESQPVQTNARYRHKYFEIDFYNDTSNGSYELEFKLPQSQINNITRVRLFIHESGIGWTQLNTSILNETSDPALFSANLTHFSKFLIGERYVNDSTVNGTGDNNENTGGGGGSGDTTEKINETGNLFDIKIIIPDKYKKIYPGEELVFEINAINLKRIGLVDVTLEYTIEDLNGNVLYKEVETRGIENIVSFLTTMDIPVNMDPGSYRIAATLRYRGEVAYAGETFEVMSDELERLPFYISDRTLIISIIVLLVLLIIGIYYEHHRFTTLHGKIEKIHRKIKLNDLIKKKKRR